MRSGYFVLAAHMQLPASKEGRVQVAQVKYIQYYIQYRGYNIRTNMQTGWMKSSYRFNPVLLAARCTLILA